MSEPDYSLQVLAYGRRWLTANDRHHWQERRRLVKSWRDYTCLLAQQAGIPPIEKAHIVCEVRFFDRRRRDPANYGMTAKACVDGLVDAGVFVDDDSTRVIGPDMRIGPVVDTAYRGLILHIFEVKP